MALKEAEFARKFSPNKNRLTFLTHFPFGGEFCRCQPDCFRRGLSEGLLLSEFLSRCQFLVGLTFQLIGSTIDSECLPLGIRILVLTSPIG